MSSDKRKGYKKALGLPTIWGVHSLRGKIYRDTFLNFGLHHRTFTVKPGEKGERGSEELKGKVYQL